MPQLRDVGSPSAQARQAPDIQSLIPHLLPRIERALAPLGGFRDACAERPDRPLPDQVLRAAIINRKNRPAAYLLISSPAAPGMVSLRLRIESDAAQLLGSDLARVILQPLDRGEVQGLTFALLPFRPALNSPGLATRLRRKLLAPRILHWLREAARATSLNLLTVPPATFAGALEFIQRSDLAPDDARRAAESAHQRLALGEWLPRHSLDHNDFWAGNILLGPGEPPFHLIDWAAANLRGHGLYDLLCAADSLGLSRRALHREILLHSAALACDPADAPGHLLAALGWLGQRKDHFPSDLYASVLHRRWSLLRWALR